MKKQSDNNRWNGLCLGCFNGVGIFAMLTVQTSAVLHMVRMGIHPGSGDELLLISPTLAFDVNFVHWIGVTALSAIAGFMFAAVVTLIVWLIGMLAIRLNRTSTEAAAPGQAPDSAT